MTTMGSRLTVELLRKIATGGTEVVVDAATRDAVARAHELVTGAAETLPVYGRTTGVGANRTTTVSNDDLEHGMRLLRSHAVEFGPVLSREQTRAMLAVRLNQLCNAGSGVRPDVLDGLALMLNTDALPEIHAYAGSIGTADLSALARTALTLVGELPASRPLPPLPHFGADSALPFMSSSALTVGRSALALAELGVLEAAAHVIFSLTALAVDANPQHWSAQAAKATVSPGCRAAAATLRAIFDAGSAQPAAARVQDPYGIRAYAIAHGALRDVTERAVATVEDLTAIAQENPIFSLDSDRVQVAHHAGFFQIGLALDFDALTNALSTLVPLATSRIRMLSEPQYTGLAPFLASGPAGSSGTMVVEYVIAAAGAEMRAASTPAAGGATVLSRGTEEDATFAPQAVTQLERSVVAWRTMLAGELLLAVRALRQRGLIDEVAADVLTLLRTAPELWMTDEDQDLRPVLEASERLLGTVGALTWE